MDGLGLGPVGASLNAALFLSLLGAGAYYGVQALSGRAKRRRRTIRALPKTRKAVLSTKHYSAVRQSARKLSARTRRRLRQKTYRRRARAKRGKLGLKDRILKKDLRIAFRRGDIPIKGYTKGYRELAKRLGLAKEFGIE